jgi:protoporphyrinogen oxidase
MTDSPHIVILGAGPAGLAAAYSLARRGFPQVTVIEQSPGVGGIAGSFDISGVRVDYGSHRLHPACDPAILRDLQSLLGDELLYRPRHGRIRLLGRWIHFPLRPLDLAFRLPPRFLAGTLVDLVARRFAGRPTRDGEASFVSVLEAGLGRTICREFYFPYAKKIWGLPAQALSADQARKRVSASSVKDLIIKIFSTAIGSPKNRFLYPRGGFGRISERLYEEARKIGVEFFLDTKVTDIKTAGSKVREVSLRMNGKDVLLKADYLWSTIPITDLAGCLGLLPAQVSSDLRAELKCRSMILVYLVLEQRRFTEFDAHYFPSSDVPITRLSEPKNYSNSTQPEDRTVLCAELPCFQSDHYWRADDDKLKDLVLVSLEHSGIPVTCAVRETVTRRIEHAYPVYPREYEKILYSVDQHLNRLENLITFGRQGLFVHDNIHHALSMGYAAADCLNDGRFNRERWQNYRFSFQNHVVED